jgi:hypothetical protein
MYGFVSAVLPRDAAALEPDPASNVDTQILFHYDLSIFLRCDEAFLQLRSTIVAACLRESSRARLAPGPGRL